MSQVPPPAMGSPMVTCADGTVCDPRTRDDWDAWVAADSLRNFLREDPLLDWLDRHGAGAGFVRDDQSERWDARTDFPGFLLAQGSRFKDEVTRLIGERVAVTRIAGGEMDARDPAKAEATLAAMRAGTPVVAQAVLRNPETRTYGVADLLVRSDIVNAVVPGTLAPQEAETGAQLLGDQPWHYVVIDVRYRSLKLDGRGVVSASDTLAYMAQVWLHNEALGRLQGWTPPAAYLLGRSSGGRRSASRSCFNRLGRVDRDAVVDPATGTTLAERTMAAVAWIRRLRAEGGAWVALPEPSIPELYPDMSNDRDAPWHAAKQRIGAGLQELTLLPATKPRHRRAAHAQGLFRWSDPRVSAASLGTWDKQAAACDAILAANREARPVVLPVRIGGDAGGWRSPEPLELFVDFETITAVADDFASMPAMGGRPLIFQVGAGWMEGGRWQFRQWTADRLTEDAEAVVIDGLTAFVDGMRRERDLAWDQVRLFHWYSAEVMAYQDGRTSAMGRHPDRDWPLLPWFDILDMVVRAGPVTIAGQFNFSIKSLAKAMHAAGLIETTWLDGPGDGSGAMVGALWCDGEAARTGGTMGDLDLMAAIGRYNEVDCRVMAEMLDWFRANR